MEDADLQEKLAERFKQLPKVVQDAITSADVEQRMRALADTQKLHLDQWEALENEVMLALLGFQPVEELQKNIKSEVGVTDEMAKTLAEEISKLVFEPVRQELERQLEPAQGNATPAATPVTPATPPAPPNEQKVERAPISETYKPGQVSTERKEVHEDPYREPPA